MHRHRRLLLLIVLACFASEQFADAKKRRRGGDEGDEGEDSGAQEETFSIADEINATIAEDFKGGNYHVAIQKLWFLTKKAEDPKDKSKALYFVGKSFVRLGLVYASVPFFSKILQYEDKEFIPLALKSIFRVSEYLKDDKFIHTTLDKIDYEFLPSDSKAEVNFYIGRSYYNDELYEKATKTFKKVFSENRYRPEALYFRGLIQYREDDLRGAIEQFKEVLEVAEDGALAKDLALMGMGRIFYELQRFKPSVKYFREVTRFSSVWHESQFESAWAYFMDGNPQKALGNIHTIQSPFYEQYFNPEAYLLKIIIFYSYCWFKDARESVEDFITRFEALSQKMTDLDAVYQQSQPEDIFFDLFKKSQRAEDPADPYKLMFHFINSEKAFGKLYRQINIIDKELAAEEHAPEFFQKEIFPLVKDRLVRLKKGKIQAAGFFIKDFLKDGAETLREQINQAKIIKFEIINSQKERLEDNLRNQSEEKNAKKVKDVSVLIDEGFEFWPFTGEYWKDELGYYIYNIVNICASDSNALP